jgi:hypothetical protein
LSPIENSRKTTPNSASTLNSGTCTVGPDGVGAEDQADQQVAEAGGNMQPLEGDHHRHTHGQQQDDLNQMIHAALCTPDG